MRKGTKLGGTTRAATTTSKENESIDVLAEFGFKGAATHYNE
jgi:hypothetical protein